MITIKPYLFVLFSILIIIVDFLQDRDKRKLVSGGILMITLLLGCIASYMDNIFSYFVFAPAILINIVNVISLLRRNEGRVNISRNKNV